MKGSEQDCQKRQHVFRILDQLKESGERINADKVARLAKMGKQTVLPYYNQWRHQAFIENEQELELPEDLVRDLKRGIANWKHHLAQEQQLFEESANQEIDELKESLGQQFDKIEQLTLTNGELQTHNQELTSELEILRQTLAQKNEELRDTQNALNSLQREMEYLKSQAEEQKVLQQQALSTLEKQLDQRHQEQLNHWLSVVDDERRLKQTLEKKIEKLIDHQQELKKENLELHNRLESKSKAYIRTCEERAVLAGEQEKARASVELAGQLLVLLDCKQDELLPVVRHLLAESAKLSASEQHCHDLQAGNEQLTRQLAESQQRISLLATVELELERTRGAAEAFEKALSKTPEVKQ